MKTELEAFVEELLTRADRPDTHPAMKYAGKELPFTLEELQAEAQRQPERWIDAKGGALPAGAQDGIWLIEVPGGPWLLLYKERGIICERRDFQLRNEAVAAKAKRTAQDTLANFKK
ncbi:MAG: hypothetical protein IT285_14550 [Bdellovibrionales bacterium]|nr:hypothetical protein [Bdellovibrionales bacterium]